MMIDQVGSLDLAPRNVLVVDDDPGINRLLQVRLRNLGYEVRSATNGEEALNSIENDQPDLMLLDVSMPGIGGLEVLNDVRARELDIAIIMTTAFGSEGVAIEALRSGANDYLRKPFESDEFRAVVARTANQLKLERQNQLLRTQLDAELHRAATIQAGLLPIAPPRVEGYDIAAICVPARVVGGDFYDWQLLPDGRLIVTLGDVMGKGLPAALLMATVRAALRSVAPDRHPADALDSVSRALDTDLDRTQSFVTIFHAELDPVRHLLTWADAGHGLAVILDSAGKLRPLGGTGLPIGIVSGSKITEHQLELQAGDTIIVCSDGLAESPGDLEAISALRESSNSTAEAIMAHIVVAAKARGPATDDRTALVIRYKGEGT